MWLENFPKVRVQKYPEWYAVEIQKSYFWISYWTHIESVTWIPNQPWYFKTKEDAIEVAQLHFKWDLLIWTIDYSNLE